MILGARGPIGHFVTLIIVTLQTVTSRVPINELDSGDPKGEAIVRNVWGKEKWNQPADETENRGRVLSPEIENRIQNDSYETIFKSTTDYPVPFKIDEISNESAGFSPEKQDQSKSLKRHNKKFSFKKCETIKCNGTKRRKDHFLNVRIIDRGPVVNGERSKEDTNESVKTERRYRSTRDEHFVNETENVRATGNRSRDDYYAKRRAVMERFYARQRQIADEHSKQLASRNKPEDGNWTRQDGSSLPDRSNLNGTGGVWQRERVEKTKSQERPIGWYQLKINEDEPRVTNNNASQRNVSRGSVQSTSCKDIPVSGKLPAKSLAKETRNLIEKQKRQDLLRIRSSNESAILTQSDTDGDERWGHCEGKVVYQHNLLLGLHGPSKLDATFEVILQEPVCISCVEALRYNQTRAVVTLAEGGRGYQFARLKLKGYENEGFSYILKVWAVKKTGDHCSG